MLSFNFIGLVSEPSNKWRKKHAAEMATAKKKQEENADNIDTMDGDSDIEDDTDYKDFSDSFKEFKENNNEADLCSSSSSNLSHGLHDTAMLASEAGMGCVTTYHHPRTAIQTV